VLEKLEIKGFKSHKYSTLKFSKGLNLIVGSSQAGKSAILQAFELLVTNRPLGGKYVHGRKTGTVLVKGVFDDHTVAIIKLISKDSEGGFKVKNASYVLDGLEPFSAIGTKVPDRVKEALNLSPINYQSQDEDSFLISTTGGVFSKTISKFIGMDEVEGVFSKLREKISKNNAVVNVLSDQVKGLKSEVKRFRLLPSIERKFSELKGVNRQLELVSEEVEALDEYVGEYGRIKRLLRVTRESSQRFEKFFKIERKLKDVEGELGEVEDYIAIDKEYWRVTDELLVVKGEYINRIKRSKSCPFCFGLITKEGIREIEEGL
jgi:exonuclease SbcC